MFLVSAVLCRMPLSRGRCQSACHWLVVSEYAATCSAQGRLFAQSGTASPCALSENAIGARKGLSKTVVIGTSSCSRALCRLPILSTQWPTECMKSTFLLLPHGGWRPAESGLLVNTWQREAPACVVAHWLRAWAHGLTQFCEVSLEPLTQASVAGRVCVAYHGYNYTRKSCGSPVNTTVAAEIDVIFVTAKLAFCKKYLLR